jgi:ABC-type transporter Mla maintaining outer membrane lipid asymmetry permease subunit MlaE
LSIVSRTTSKRPRVVVIAITRAHRGLAPVVITVAIAGAAAAATTRRVGAPFVVSRIEVSRIEVHG